MGNNCYRDLLKNTEKEFLLNYSFSLLDNIKSKYILMNVFNNLNDWKKLQIIKINKRLRQKLEIDIEDYKELSKTIEIEIIPVNKKSDIFINIPLGEQKSYFHMYYNYVGNEMKNNYIQKEDIIQKINLIIDFPVKSFQNLFKGCKWIESIKFKRFNRDNITNMKNMFYDCTSLKELNFSRFNSINVTNMFGMFYECSKLKEIDLSNFNTSNVIDMNGMFYGCASLKKINLKSFNTEKVTDMKFMFAGCSNLKELNLENFNTKNVTDMYHMFSRCKSLQKLKFTIYNINSVFDTKGMFYLCSYEFQKIIEIQMGNIKKSLLS